MSLLTISPLLRLLKRPSLTLCFPVWLKSLRGGFILFLVIFGLVQGVSILLLTRLVNTTSTNIAEAHQLSHRQALLDKTRSELLSASDNSHRAGIFLMQDNQTGSVDSWKSLAEAAQLSLNRARQLFEQYPVAADSPLTQNFMLLADGLQEQLKGLNAKNIDAFFMVPMQAFSQQFNEAYYQTLAQANQQSADLNRLTLSSLTNNRNLAMAISALLGTLLLLGGAMLLRGVILPLDRVSEWLAQIATGDISHRPGGGGFQSTEINQLTASIGAMQRGLQHIVGEINTISGAVHHSAGCMAQQNDEFSAQHQQQILAFNHISQRLNRVAQEVGHSVEFTHHATREVQAADLLAQRCGKVVASVETQMHQIVAASGEIASFVTLLEGISLQTRLLALNAAIESAHAGVYGRSFSIVAKEIGLLSEKSSASTRTIDGLIDNTHQHINSGFHQVQTLDGLYHQIATAVTGVVSLLNELQQNADAQSRRVNAVAQEIAQLNQQAKESERLTHRSAETSELLVSHAARLARSVSQFVL
ncbi:methyl-accepting chemotaxis protein [Erwinia piriflorinigrans]|uniref:Methyl-accepting chemotaxis protein II MCP-II n=1 Tax=Erwinia piriflorinigrans CFBP 5888 TaxID=1161919 RepID=V5Z9H6_9GAMM|nr:methyl-accepting chemotaxis protein [Erwinia piriflorinigrans]CCG87590.1 Methyl-accepting chemotaxis protein II MCP-II [Erwinia piriflorinigrans CFBP 5888]